LNFPLRSCGTNARLAAGEPCGGDGERSAQRGRDARGKRGGRSSVERGKAARTPAPTAAAGSLLPRRSGKQPGGLSASAPGASRLRRGTATPPARRRPRESGTRGTVAEESAPVLALYETFTTDGAHLSNSYAQFERVLERKKRGRNGEAGAGRALRARRGGTHERGTMMRKGPLMRLCSIR